MCSDTDALNEACVAGGNWPGRTITQQRALNRKVWQRSLPSVVFHVSTTPWLPWYTAQPCGCYFCCSHRWRLAFRERAVVGAGGGAGGGWLREEHTRSSLNNKVSSLQHNTICIMHHVRSHTKVLTHTSARLSPHRAAASPPMWTLLAGPFVSTATRRGVRGGFAVETFGIS